MRKVIAVVVVLAVCGIGFGFYRGWFALSSPSPAAGTNEVNVNLATDTDKMKEDAQTVKDKVGELTSSDVEGPAEPAERPAVVKTRPEASNDGQFPPGESTEVPARGNER